MSGSVWLQRWCVTWASSTSQREKEAPHNAQIGRPCRACTALSNLTLGMVSLCTLDMCHLSVGKVAYALGQIGQAYGSCTSEVVGAAVILVLVLVAACKETRTGSAVVAKAGNGPEGEDTSRPEVRALEGLVG